MYMHIYKYRLKKLIRSKELVFWSLIFPFLLGTLFYFSFGTISERAEKFSEIPVAFVVEEGTLPNPMLTGMINSLSIDSDQPMLKVQKATQETAAKLLEDEEIDGIITSANESVHLTLSKDTINQSILKNIMDTYVQMETVIQEAQLQRPEQITQIVENFQTETSFNKEISLGGDNLDTMLQYFYALLAMTCLFSCYFGINNAIEIQANLSPLAARRNVSPSHKLGMLFCEFFAALTLHLAMTAFQLFYLIVILGIDFGQQFAHIALVCILGSTVGISFGLFIGTAIRAAENVKTAVVTGVSLFLCFLGGLMFANMKDIIEHTIPLVNRINPAALISDAFYCLNIYDDYSKFYTNIISLLIIAILFCMGSFLIIRRKKYASI